jgi:hypothetical protein
MAPEVVGFAPCLCLFRGKSFFQNLPLLTKLPKVLKTVGDFEAQVNSWLWKSESFSNLGRQ